jgi:hypothetical protein
VISAGLGGDHRPPTDIRTRASRGLGGEAVLEGELSIVALANGWITISVGGGPTDDKPGVTLAPPSDPDHASSFPNIRIADIAAVYKQWSARGASFLTRRSIATARSVAARPRRPPNRGRPAGGATR